MNCYKFARASCKNLKMDGSLGESNRFLLSEALAVHEGDRIVFGPMRPHQPVMGYFYDQDHQPLMLINHTNVEITHTFKEGMIMASILAPAEATIRLQLTEAEKEQFAIYINEENYDLPSEEALTNPLFGRIILNIGDSLCSAARDEKIDGLRGWARRLRDRFGAMAVNYGQGGSGFSTGRLLLRPCMHPHQLILNQLPAYPCGLEYDYILLEGGGNDAAVGAPVGEMSDSFDPETFDLSTYAGGFEMLLHNVVKKFGDTAAIGYMSVYKMPLAPKFADTAPYFVMGEKICKKWGIEYLDLYNTFELDTEKYTWNGKEGEDSKPDYVHANKEGYDLMQPHINEFMLKIRPIPLNIYKAVTDENHFHAKKTIGKKMKPNGKMVESERFLVCDPLAVGEGDQITFGPARLGAPVLGFFYDQEDQPLALINYKSIEIAHTFKEGMVMATATAPAGAKAIRLQMPMQDQTSYRIYMNEEPQIEEEPTNPLYGRNVLTVGDSLCAAAKDIAVDDMKGWAQRIRDGFGANVTNAGTGGAAFSNCRLSREKATVWHQIFRQIHRFEGEYDYILLEGGANDAWDKAPLGEISDSFDPESFDLTTFAGGMEMLIHTAVKTYGDTAAIGYMSIFKTPHYFKTLFSGEYFELGRKICEKWGIPYLDIHNDVELDTIKYTVDGIHANKEGYDILAPYINAFMLKLRPVSSEIYMKVTQTADIVHANATG